MSGHSKWANIRVRKGAQDAKRGKIYTRHARLIEIAARMGGGDPAGNPGLRTAIENAKADSVPNANIDRAIKKGTGELKGDRMEEILYEAYGPGGTAYLIECLSDNRNRTAASVRSIVGKAGGRMADSGAVSYLFARKGRVVGQWSVVNGQWSDAMELELIDAGAEDIRAADESVEIITGVSDWSKVRDLLKAKGIDVSESGLAYVPQQRVPVDDDTAQKVLNFLEKLEEDDDVSQVHTNTEF